MENYPQIIPFNPSYQVHWLLPSVLILVMKDHEVVRTKNPNQYK